MQATLAELAALVEGHIAGRPVLSLFMALHRSMTPNRGKLR